MSDELKSYKLFISHINKDDPEYDLFLDKLGASYDFQWSDVAVRDKILPDEITQQMKPADVVIILSGLCSKDKALITGQIDAAAELKKPIVVIRPYGLENVSPHLEKIAAEVVGWNTPCIVDAIKQALQEEYID